MRKRYHVEYEGDWRGHWKHSEFSDDTLSPQTIEHLRRLIYNLQWRYRVIDTYTGVIYNLKVLPLGV